MDIYITVGEETKGPYSRAEILDGLKQGAFSKDDLCAQEGWDEWKKLGDVFKERPVAKSPKPKAAKPPRIPRKPVAKKPAAWRSEKITTKQRDYLKSLGKKPPRTKGEASDMINSVTSPPATPRQQAKLAYLQLPCDVTKNRANDLLDEIEADPAWNSRIAEWDRVKTSLYPDLYNADGSYRDGPPRTKISLSAIFLFLILGVIFCMLIYSLFL
jgi:hypothetical protein